MSHAVVATRISSAPVLRPVGRLDEFFVRLHIPIGHQVTGPLPPEQRVRRDAPRRALEVDLAFKEVEEQRRVIQAPPLAVTASEGLREQFPRLGYTEEVVLVGRLLVGVRGRDHHLVDLDLVVQEVQHVDDVLRRVGVEERRVRGDPKALFLQELDGLDRLFEHALFRDRFVVTFLQTVDVNREREVRRRLEVELVPTFAHEFGVGAQVDILLALDKLVDHHVDLRVHQRLTARERHHRRASFLDRRDRPLDRHPLTEQIVWLLDLPAPVAFEVAREERLEFDDQRKLAHPVDLLGEQVPADTDALAHWNSHQPATPFGSIKVTSSAATERSTRSTVPSWRNVSMTSSTRWGGAEAPAVIPIVEVPTSHSGRMSFASSTR